MAKQLLIVADDFGACKEINDGIIKCAEAGSIDCVDAFVTFGEQSKQAIQEFQQKFAEQLANGSLRLGLHLTLTCGKPVATNLSDDFVKLVTYNSTNAKLKKRHWGKFMELPLQEIDKIGNNYITDVKKEIRAQLQLFRDITGHDPSHISCHEGCFHLSPELAVTYFGVVKANELFVRNPCLLGFSNGKWNEKTTMIKRGLKTTGKLILNGKIGINDAEMYLWTTKGIWEYIHEEKNNHGLKTTTNFIEHFFGVKNDEYSKKLEWIFERLDHETYELITHPVWFEGTTIQEASKDIPGIEWKTFRARRGELLALNESNLLNNLYEKFMVERIDLPWNLRPNSQP